MKKVLIVLLFCLIASLLGSCVPVEPKDMLPYCKEQYAAILEDDPNFPHSYVGACVASLQTGKPNAFVSLCGYEPFWAIIEDSEGVVINSRQECITFIKSME